MVRVVQPEVRTVITSQQTVVRVEYIREKKKKKKNSCQPGCASSSGAD